MNIEFNINRQFINHKTLRKLNIRCREIYKNNLYKSNYHNIWELNEQTIKFENEFYKLEKILEKKIKKIFKISKLKFSKLWIVHSEYKDIDNSKLPYIAHFDKERYFKAMIYLNNVSLNHGPIYFAKAKKKIILKK